MATFHTTLFDTWAMLAAAASPPQLLFQVIRGGDAVHIDTFTNMRGAGQLPSSESFEVHKISLALDDNIVYADLAAFLVAALIEMRIKEKTVFSAPARHLLDGPRFYGNSVTAAAALVDAMTVAGLGFELEIPITIPGGVNFVVQGTPQPAALAAATNVKVILGGILTTPD